MNPLTLTWSSLVDQLRRPDQPSAALLAWIDEESGGNACSVGLVSGSFSTEAGIGQQYFDGPDSSIGGVTSSMLRAACGNDPHNSTPIRDLTDEEKRWQVQALVADVAASQAAARASLASVGASWDESGADFWSLVKLHHALPSIARELLPAYAQTVGTPPSSWSTWTSWVKGLSPEDLATMAPTSSRFDIPHWFANAEAVGNAVGGGGWLPLALGVAGALLLLFVFRLVP